MRIATWFSLILLVIAAIVTAKEPSPVRKGGFMMKMPGQSDAGPFVPLDEAERELAKRLQSHVDELAGKIGERNTSHFRKLTEAAQYIDRTFTAFGYRVDRQKFTAKGRECENLIVEIPGRDDSDQRKEIVVIGAHYDSAPQATGANDNASGVSAVLELARDFFAKRPVRTLRFVAFTNEEPPHFQTDTMGSLVYAASLKKRGDNVVAMISLETIGYYSDQPHSQKYPAPFNLFYPSTGNFIGFIGNVESAELVTQSVKKFRETTKFPSEGGAVPGHIDGVGWSDHWSFWQQGYPALMVTDTAPFRYPHYHTREDTPDKCDYEKMARVVSGVGRVIEDLVDR